MSGSELSLRRSRSSQGGGIAGHRAVRSAYLELVPVAGLAAMLSLMLLFALLRVVVMDIMSVLPLGGYVETTAGRLYVERSAVTYSWVCDLVAGKRSLLLAIAATLTILSAAVLYVEARLFQRSRRLALSSSCASARDLHEGYGR